MNLYPSFPHPLLADPAYNRLKECLIAWTGLAYYTEKDRELATRIAFRMTKVCLPDCASYLNFLQNGPQGQNELDALIADLTIGETFFFRHQEMFDAIRNIVIPDVLARNRHSRRLRIWSAGCAIGAEPYSVAILLKRDFAHQLVGWDWTIVGTDINREFLARAQEGIFDEWAFRNTPENVKQSCFAHVGKTMRINSEYRERVSFQYHNLVTHPSPALLNNLFAFDVILCRNVTIYFSAAIIRQLTERFHQSLVEGGWLLVGHAEPNVESFQSFRTHNAPGAVLYQKTEVGGSKAEHTSIPLPGSWSPPSLVSPPAEAPQIQAIEELSLSVSEREPEVLVPAPQSSDSSQLDSIRALADRGEWAKAAACCEASLQRDKLNPRVHFYRALVLEQMGQLPEAEQAFRRVIYLDRSFVLGHYYLGLLLQKMGMSSPAARSFRNVLTFLARIDAEQVIVDGSGIHAGELQKRTEMHLKILEGA
ncbi:MAG TPA: CheR family methyltransferase [Gemmata sp.]|nr:CheR family methyltransferase [Gemmata sp.]